MIVLLVYRIGSCQTKKLAIVPRGCQISIDLTLACVNLLTKKLKILARKQKKKFCLKTVILHAKLALVLGLINVLIASTIEPSSIISALANPTIILSTEQFCVMVCKFETFFHFPNFFSNFVLRLKFFF